MMELLKEKPKSKSDKKKKRKRDSIWRRGKKQMRRKSQGTTRRNRMR